MNPVDASVGAVVLGGALLGLRRGLVAQIVGLTVLVGGLYGATRASPWVARTAHALDAWAPVPRAPFDGYVAWIAVFAGFAIAVTIVGHKVKETVRRSPLAPLDRAGGALLGGAKGVLVCYLLLYLALCHPARPLEAEMRDSIAAPILLRAVDRTALLFPREFQARSDACVREAEIARAARERGEPVPCAIPAPIAAKPPTDRPAANPLPAAIPGRVDDRSEAPPGPP